MQKFFKSMSVEPSWKLNKLFKRPIPIPGMTRLPWVSQCTVFFH